MSAPAQGPGPIVSASSHYVDLAVKAAKEINAFAKAAQKMKEEGKTLNEIEEALASMTFLTKLTVGLQCVSMGLSLLQVFLPVKSQQSQILDGVEEIIGRVDALQSTLDSRFQQVSLETNIATQKAALLHDMSEVEAATRTLNSIRKLQAAGMPFDSQVRDLLKFNTADFKTVISEIVHVVTGSGVASNLLADLYTKSYGDIDVVWPIAEYLLQQAQLCVVLIGAIKGLEEKARVTAAAGQFDDTKAMAIADSVADDHDDQLATIAKAVHKYCAECTNPISRREQVKRYIQDNKFGFLAIVEVDMPGSATRLATGLQAKWPYLNFGTIVYDPLAGFDRHGMTGNTSSYLTLFRERTLTGKAVNIVVYLAERTTAGVPALRSGNALVPSDHTDDSRAKALIAFHHMCNGTPRGQSYVEKKDDATAFFFPYKLLLSPLKPSLNGSFVWYGFIAHDTPEKLGVASFATCHFYTNRRDYRLAPPRENEWYPSGEYYRCVSFWPD